MHGDREGRTESRSPEDFPAGAEKYAPNVVGATPLPYVGAVASIMAVTTRWTKRHGIITS